VSCKISTNSTTEKLEDNKLVISLEEQKIPIRLSCFNTNGYPCVISLWFKILNGKILCATRPNAKIVKYLSKNNLVGFEIASDKSPYRGIRGNGSCQIKQNEGKQVLQILVSKYLGQGNSELRTFLLKNANDEVALEITPHNLFQYDYTKRMDNVIL
jgi:nitroimidazol reductase NimA-like FMN-containing flavoprotein (pyridoxamine 5'-phosphate oxidase superfamily)